MELAIGFVVLVVIIAAWKGLERLFDKAFDEAESGIRLAARKSRRPKPVGDRPPASKFVRSEESRDN